MRSETPLQSKKFISFILSEVTWKIVIMVAIFHGGFPYWALLLMIFTSGAVEIGYILGQASLDRYIHVADLTALKAQGVSH